MMGKVMHATRKRAVASKSHKLASNTHSVYSVSRVKSTFTL